MTHVALSQRNGEHYLIILESDGHKLIRAGVFGLAQRFVGSFDTLHSLAISQQVEHAMTLAHEFLAALVQHLIH